MIFTVFILYLFSFHKLTWLLSSHAALDCIFYDLAEQGTLHSTEMRKIIDSRGIMVSFCVVYVCYVIHDKIYLY